ncbi:unnamed protein product [Psylliodes chrysocephalus]|uniref:Uncharacterized protein n=1 Tax=Psylliodes chrysocephalus TaxID=3402493 RepID=A0A9P0CDQ6_9CUCU|nr:unnamed protein product [Psylliodes chrysocephala]
MKIFLYWDVYATLHLGSSAACTKLPKSVEEFVRNLYNHFSNSSRRIDEFEEYQKFLQFKPHKLLRPAQTRWPSLQIHTLYTKFTSIYRSILKIFVKRTILGLFAQPILKFI